MLRKGPVACKWEAEILLPRALCLREREREKDKHRERERELGVHGFIFYVVTRTFACCTFWVPGIL